MTPGAGGLGGRGLERSTLGLSSSSRLLLMDSLLGGKAGFSSAVDEDGGGGKGPEKWELPLTALGFHSLSLERVAKSEMDEGTSGRGLDQLFSELVLLLELSSSFSWPISPGSGAKKLGLEALLVFLYLSMNVIGAQPSWSSIWMNHQPLEFFSMTWKYKMQGKCRDACGISRCVHLRTSKKNESWSFVCCYTHFNFHSRLEANAIWDGRLKVRYGVILLLYLWGHWRFGQIRSSWLE